ncbi:MAG: FAD-dependent oxidoreductase [Oscillospiraceae bacterium]|nr:FAD-dependent oxidoreductase [Oscillospiraceae bacterium]
MPSIWTETTELPHFPPLKGNSHTDVLIIGGGIAGLLCAYQLQQAGINYILVEANTICSGITKNTTAKITAQHGLIYHKLIKQYGIEKARLYLDANQEALDVFDTLCKTIDCNYVHQDSFVYSINDRKKLDSELDALEKIGFSATYSQSLPLPFPTAGAVKFPRQAQFHPLKFLAAVAKNLRIYERTPIRELAKRTAKTDTGTITAESIIVTTHFPMLNKHGSYFLKLFQHRSYCMALENITPIEGMYVDESQKGLSFRTQGDLLILGGGSHRTGKKGGNWSELEDFIQRNYPQAKVRCQWATQDCMTLDGIPYIGQYSNRTPNLYVATGFNKWGMTSAMVAAQMLTGLIQGKDTPYEDVFSPSRSILHPQLAINGFEAVTNLLSFTKKRCPHMGCALRWNPQEHSWDCPCHGSRFQENGKLIDGPSTGNLKN